MPTTAPEPRSKQPAAPEPRSKQPAAAGAPWVIFDADNTLWHVEELYDGARADLVALLAAQGVDADVVEREQRRRDLALFPQLGYAPQRFEQGFVETAQTLLPSALAEELRPEVAALARSVFRTPARCDPEAEVAIRSLAPHFRLAILTAGDPAIQRCRLAEFPYATFFDAIDIVQWKTAEVFDTFCAVHALDRAASYVIGDSLRSDVRPARAVGLNAIWVTSANWHEHEVAAHEVPEGALVAKSLSAAAQRIIDTLSVGVSDTQ